MHESVESLLVPAIVEATTRMLESQGDMHPSSVGFPSMATFHLVL